MARVRVLTTSCDRCHFEVDQPMPEKPGEGLLLPAGWLHVSGITTVTVEFAMDLCRDCKTTVMAAAGAA